MAWAPDYATLQQLKDHLRVTTTDDDAELAMAITSASRAIDYFCDRQFGNETQVRYYSADSCRRMYLDGRWVVPIDDVYTKVGLVVSYDDLDDGSWSQPSTIEEDFALWPYNAAADGKPWTHLAQIDRGTYRFPWTTNGIRVSANFGWLDVPAVVVSATLILASKVFVRRDSANLVSGSPLLGNDATTVLARDPELQYLLSPVRRRWGAA